MGARRRGDTATAPSTPARARLPPLTLAQRVFTALVKHTLPSSPTDFVLPFCKDPLLATYFHDLANSIRAASDYTLDFTRDEIAEAEAVELTWLPPKYSKTSKNVYLVRKAPLAQASSSSRCTCYGQDNQRGSSTRPAQASSPVETTRSYSSTNLKQVEDPTYCNDTCHNRLVLIECGKNTCSAPDPSKCRNRPFQRKATKATRVQYMGPKGFGLVADEAIQVGDFVVEYVGEVIDEAMAADRRAANLASGNTHTYMLEMEKDILIDAQYKGNVSRFINHSCAPNCSAQKWTCEGNVLRIGIVAHAPIARGEEITFDYQFTHVGATSVTCHCGAATCKGQMGFKEKDTIKAEDKTSDSHAQPWTRPIKVSSLALFKSARLDRDWLDEYGFAKKRLFLSHAVHDDVDVDSYYNSIRPTKRQTTSNWYHQVLTNPPTKTTSFLAGGVLDYTKLLSQQKTKKRAAAAPSPAPRPRRKSLLDSRYQLIKEVHQFAEGRSVWNARLRVSTANLDVARIYRFVENIENGVHHQHGETNDLNEDACHRCGTAGELICCDGCPAAFHLSCVGLHNLPPRNVDWYCPSCKRSKTNVPSTSAQRLSQTNAIFQVGPAPETKRWHKRKVGRPKRVVLATGETTNMLSASPDRVDMA
ncbi:hypothetical protein H310_11686 [Aphanomyces invadans]|uniref:Histone-lysine N-methyltransferase n=1 Tax=Aphanomyces invadans TaxID=157072 RepID=A0A024TKZ5_9STRA|nr:hypothetical protein H310_11686 [Aphanomyces invadans]ETV94713.1 hypothetical protein H310_11686 [Aphanomyces invadans]|eukprot:XP_008876658.1 hypothetical protein H310_11686 [Aphanomyces invadans]